MPSPPRIVTLYRVRREDHNTLALRAEIGRLVEEIVAADKDGKALAV